MSKHMYFYPQSKENNNQILATGATQDHKDCSTSDFTNSLPLTDKFCSQRILALLKFLSSKVAVLKGNQIFHLFNYLHLEEYYIHLF